MATTAMCPAVDGRVALAILDTAAVIAVATGTTALITKRSATAAGRKLRLELASTRRKSWLIGGMVLLLPDLGLEQHHSLLYLGELRHKLLLCFVRTGGRVGHLSDEIGILIVQSLVGSEGTLESIDDLLD
jgi:hypothetical protein